MLRTLEGKVLLVNNEYVVLDVNGMGFEIYCSGSALRICSSSDMATLVTFLQVSENGLALYGFSDEEERDIFLKLTSIKGIGGKLALTVLRHLSPEEIVASAYNSDINAFAAVPGIGKKTAERICFEMKRHFENQVPDRLLNVSTRSRGLVRATVSEALRSLGFPNQKVNIALDRLHKRDSKVFSSMDESQMLKATLKELNAM
ncbi:MAG TPA: Holliday junction branch migration protein RuvA [Synergistales bacterium]|nr:Holliday junction branch migration protein RuvA [Synergistales bacterium]